MGTNILSGLVEQGSWGQGPDNSPVMRTGHKVEAQVEAQNKQQNKLSSYLRSGLVLGNQKAGKAEGGIKPSS